MLLKNSPLSNTSEKLKSPQTSIKNIKFERKKDFKSFLKFIERESKALEEIKVPSLDETKKKKGSSFGAALGLGALGLLALFGGRDGDPDDQPNKFDYFDPEAFKKSIARQSQISSLALVGQKAITYKRPDSESQFEQNSKKFGGEPPNTELVQITKNKQQINKKLIVTRKVKLNEFLKNAKQLELDQKEIDRVREEVNNAKEERARKINKKLNLKKEVVVGGRDVKSESGSVMSFNEEEQFLKNERKISKKINPNTYGVYTDQVTGEQIDKDIVDKLLKEKKRLEKRLVSTTSFDKKNRIAKEIKKINQQLGIEPLQVFSEDDKKFIKKYERNQKNLRKLEVFNTKMMDRLQPFLSLLSIKGTLIKDMLKVEPFADGTMDAYLEREKKRKEERLNLISEISSKIITGEMEVPSLIDSLNLDKLKIPPVNYQLPIDGNNSDQFFIYPIDDGPSFTDLLMIKELEKY